MRSTARIDSIPCPHCGHGISYVIDSRPSPVMHATGLGKSTTARRRRRRCAECGERFRTFEQAVSDDAESLTTYSEVRAGLTRLGPIDQRRLVMEFIGQFLGFGGVKVTLAANETEADHHVA